MQSLVRVTETLSRMDAGNVLQLVLAGIDESSNFLEVPGFYQPVGGGETAWVTKGKVVGSSILGQNAELYTKHLLRSVREYPAPGSWPTAVVRLAEAVYNGADATFALHDALLEAGHPDLAEHFQKEAWHPKGCWVLDLILGKE